MLKYSLEVQRDRQTRLVYIHVFVGGLHFLENRHVVAPFRESRTCIYHCKYVFDSTSVKASSSFVLFFFSFSGFHYWTDKGSEESRSNVEGKDVGRVLELCYPCVCLYFDSQ